MFSSPYCINVFKANHFVAFWCSNNLSNLLVSAKLHKPATTRKMVILLKQECQKHFKLLRSEFNQILDQLRSQCSTLTFKQINHFLRDSACELSRELHSRHRKKLSASTGVCAPLAFIRTRHNNSYQLNRSNRPQILVNCSHSPVTTSNPSTASLPLSIIPHPHATQPSAPNLSSGYLWGTPRLSSPRLVYKLFVGGN